MARKTIEQRLAELDAQRATLKARLGKQERANDTRRKVLLGALRQMTALGHTIVAVEHHQEFIAEADYVVDLGPDAGPRGGRVVATGTPREIAAHPESVTGACLRELFARLDAPR